MENVVHVAKGVGVAMVVTLIALIVFAVALTYSNITESAINPVTMIVSGLSILLGSFLGNKEIKKNGLLNGGLVGIIYVAVLYIVSSLLNWKFSLSAQSIVMIVVGIICGISGGVLGVNVKK